MRARAVTASLQEGDVLENEQELIRLLGIVWVIRAEQ